MAAPPTPGEYLTVKRAAELLGVRAPHTCIARGLIPARRDSEGPAVFPSLARRASPGADATSVCATQVCGAPARPPCAAGTGPASSGYTGIR